MYTHISQTVNTISSSQRCQSTVLCPSISSRFTRQQRARRPTFPSLLFITTTATTAAGWHRLPSAESECCALASKPNNVTPGPSTRRERACLFAKPSELSVKSEPASIDLTTTTAPPAPVPPPQQVPSRPLIRRLLLIRLACDSYAPHPSPGIPHEQPQHVSVDVDTTTHDQPRTYQLTHLEPGSYHHLPSCPSLCQLQ